MARTVTVDQLSPGAKVRLNSGRFLRKLVGPEVTVKIVSIVPPKEGAYYIVTARYLGVTHTETVHAKFKVELV